MKTIASKVCRTCGQDKPLDEYQRSPAFRDGRVIHCKPCLNEKRREINKTPKYRAIKAKSQAKTNPWDRAARNLVYAAVYLGMIPRWPCEVCGNPRVHAHHADYDNPLGVTWLCPQHHSDVHRLGDELGCDPRPPREKWAEPARVRWVVPV